MAMVDKNILVGRVEQIEKHLRKIAAYRRMSLREFLRDEKTQDIVEYNLFQIVNHFIDIIQHIVVDEEYGFPQTAYEAAQILTDKKILTAKDLKIFKNMIGFFSQLDKMEKVQNIARDPNDIPPPITRTEPATVKIEMETKEVIAEIAPGVSYNFWTFDGTVPGPFLRVKEGDTVELTLKNNPSSVHHHSIDLHAVTGPGGGAAVTTVEPGESKMLKFKALNPGLYIYHCAHPNVATHDAHGMYGLILVEPKEGLPKVDREFYVMQGEFYSTGGLGKKGLQIFDAQKMLDGHPEYVVFNGKTKGLVGNMKANVGESVRIFIGNGGVNLISSFHVIGEIFDTVYPEASIGGALFKNVQTTLVPAGGAAITDFKLEVPGKYILVDHALSRLERGAWGVLEVAGDKNPEVFDGSTENIPHGH